jgi:hypothetical protein
MIRFQTLLSNSTCATTTWQPSREYNIPADCDALIARWKEKRSAWKRKCCGFWTKIKRVFLKILYKIAKIVVFLILLVPKIYLKIMEAILTLAEIALKLAEMAVKIALCLIIGRALQSSATYLDRALVSTDSLTPPC